MPKISTLWIILGYPALFLFAFFFGACFNRKDKGSAHIRVGREWMTTDEYFKRYGGKK